MALSGDGEKKWQEAFISVVISTWVRRQHQNTEHRYQNTDLFFQSVICALGSVICLYGAGDGIRTRDPNLGKVVLYQLSYTRIRKK